jgi:hypothetical protein
MKKEKHLIEFKCIVKDCNELLSFSVLEIEKTFKVKCTSCNKEYTFNEEFIDKIKKFENLILSVRKAKDILGNTNVAIDIEEHSIKIPYRMLLTRLNTLITLKIGKQTIDFRFRVEPLKG